MITAKIKCYLVPASYDFKQGYSYTARLLAALHDAAPDIAPSPGRWLGGVLSPGSSPIAFTERDVFEQRLSKAFPDDPFLITVYTHIKVRKPGGIEILYMPQFGRLDISVYKPDKALGANAANAMRSLLAAAVAWQPPLYAFVNISDNNPQKANSRVHYSPHFSTFKHRRPIGWMAYVPSAISAEQLPDAAEVRPVGTGTIVVSVAGPFDLANPEHIKAANQLEMDMNDLGLLPVTDPSF